MLLERQHLSITPTEMVSDFTLMWRQQWDGVNILPIISIQVGQIVDLRVKGVFVIPTVNDIQLLGNGTINFAENNIQEFQKA